MQIDKEKYRQVETEIPLVGARVVSMNFKPMEGVFFFIFKTVDQRKVKMQIENGEHFFLKRGQEVQGIYESLYETELSKSCLNLWFSDEVLYSGRAPVQIIYKTFLVEDTNGNVMIELIADRVQVEFLD